MADLNQLMKMGQQLQAKMGELQGELDGRKVSASSGGGMVTVVVDGKGGVRSVQIDPVVVDPRDVEMLEDLVLAALHEAQKKALEQYEADVRKATGGLPIQIPGLG